MVYKRRLLYCLLIMLFLNCMALFYTIHINTALKIFASILLLGLYIYFNIKPRADNAPSKRIKTLIGGRELILIATICLISELILYFYICLISNLNIDTTILLVNGILSIVFIAVMLLNGFIRIFATSSQLGVRYRLCLILLWWMPVVNVILFYKVCKIAGSEYKFELEKQLRNSKRTNSKICETKYPILMVHGIFFRDWKLFDYWGRISKELINNGAMIYYGNQQSSTSVEQSASELKERILGLLNELGCEKVNIIAHSKGGLDSRYAISCLDMGGYVASLTTINTPHFGCNFVGTLIDKTPEKLVSVLGKQYASIFTKLGDDEPDFFSGINELTTEKCAELNKKMIDCEGILYQSVGSKMHSSASAAFPLSISYNMIKPLDGDNDGLVATSSMVWGDYLGTLTSTGKLGISHGDMIDLTRKNIPGFDVCEYYVNLVKGLKEKGL